MGFEPTLYIAVDVGFKTVSKVVGYQPTTYGDTMEEWDTGSLR